MGLRTHIVYEKRDMLFCMVFDDGTMIWTSEGDCPLGHWPKCDDWYAQTMKKIEIANQAIDDFTSTFVEIEFENMDDYQKRHHLLHAEEAGQGSALVVWIEELKENTLWR